MRETALAVARAFLAEDDDDPVHRHQLAALAGETGSTRAPADYVAAYFDRFADTSTMQMYEVLQYCGPRKLEPAGRGRRGVTARACSISAAAPARPGALLRAGATRLVGVDLSAKMLAKARGARRLRRTRPGRHGRLPGRAPRRFDLVFAADSLIYLGDLAPLLAAAAEALVAGGALALTLETTSRGAFELTSSGRFAHSPSAVIAAAAPWFSACARGGARSCG